MRREVTILILQERPIGLEAQQDSLRKVQLFPLFSFASSLAECRQYLHRRTPDAILFVLRDFPDPFDHLLLEIRQQNRTIPVIAVLPNNQAEEGMEFLRRGAQDFFLESEMDRLVPSLYLALRDHPVVGGTLGGAWADSPAAIPEDAGFAPVSDEIAAPPEVMANILDIVTELDIVGKILYESPAVMAVLGYTQEELLGRSAFSLIHPMDVPRVMPVFMVALANPGIPHSARFRFKHKNGRWRVLESVGKSMERPDGSRRVLVTSRDITDHRTERTHSTLAEAQFMAVVEGLGEGLLITDTADKILYANKRMGEITGYAITELLGKLSYKIFLSEQAWPIYMQQKEKWLLGDREEYELSMRCKDGSQICAHITISPNRDSHGHITGTLAAFTNITSRKEAELEAQHAFEQLQSAKERAEAMNRLKNSFLANMSHEIRTPINSILGFASILIESLEDNELVEFASTIESAGKRLFQTFEGILDLASVESDTLELHPETLSLDEKAAAAVAVFERLALEKGLTLTVEARQPVFAFVDEHYLGRVLFNLIGNAIKFTDAGSVRIVIEAASSGNGLAYVHIYDTGVGISDDFMSKLFTEFEQESRGIARSYEGVGLGLRISKVLMERMGGTIQVESSKGFGTCFTLGLPVHSNGVAVASAAIPELAIP